MRDMERIEDPSTSMLRILVRFSMFSVFISIIVVQYALQTKYYLHL